MMAQALATTRISKEDLCQYFQQRKMLCNEASGEITVDFSVQTLTGRQYKLRLYVPRDFPGCMDPTLAVIDPRCLFQRNNTAISQNSPEFQTLGQTSEGFQILSVSYSKAAPNAAVFVHQIFLEGTLWVNAYDEYIATGVKLAQHIQQCRQNENESYSTPASPVQFWSDLQMNRIAREKRMLDKFFKSHNVEWSHDRRAVNVTIELSQDKTYILEVHLHHDFPNSLPILAIGHPQELFQINGEPLPEFSEDFATLGKKHDRLIICHFRPNEWMDNYNIASVINKGKVWVHAYEQYLSGNKPGASFRDCICELSQCSELE